MKKLFALAIAFVLTGNAALADQTAWVKITELNLAWDFPRLNLKIDGAIPNLNNCANPNQAAFDGDPNPPPPEPPTRAVNYDEMFALAVAAFTAQKEVRLAIANNDCSLGQRPRIRGIDVR